MSDNADLGIQKVHLLLEKRTNSNIFKRVSTATVIASFADKHVAVNLAQSYSVSSLHHYQANVLFFSQLLKFIKQIKCFVNRTGIKIDLGSYNVARLR